MTKNKPTPNFLQAGCPSCHPTNSVEALKGKCIYRDVVSLSSVVELPDDEVNQGKLLMYNRAELKTSDHRSELYCLDNVVIYLKGSAKEPNMFHNYETKKITRKASDAAENLQLQGAAK